MPLHVVHATENGNAREQPEHDLMKHGVLKVMVIACDEDGQGCGEDQHETREEGRAAEGECGGEDHTHGIYHGQLIQQLHRVWHRSQNQRFALS